MKEILSKFGKWDYIFLMLLGIGYAFLIIQYVPCLEDLNYCFERSNNNYQLVGSLKEAVRSQSYDYQHENGRFVVHTIVQWFCGYTGPIPFFIGSTLAAVLLVTGIVYLLRIHNDKKYFFEVPLVSLLLLLFVPVISKTYIGHIAFTMNYLWGSCLYIWFLIFYYKLLNHEVVLIWWKCVLLCLFATICGQWNESFGIGVGGALFIYHSIHIKETKGMLLAYLLSFAVGLLTNILAPANFVRSSASGVLQYSSLFEVVKSFVITISSIVFTVPFVVFIVAVVFALVINRRSKWQFIKDNYLLILPQFIAFVFAVFIAFIGNHQMTMVVLLSVVLFCKVIHDSEWRWLSIVERYVSIVLLIILVAMYIPIYYYRSQTVDKTKVYIESMCNATDSVADSKLIEQYIEYELPKTYFSKYVNRSISLTYTTKGQHLSLSHYLTKDSTVLTKLALPCPIIDIVEQCNQNNELTENMYRFSQSPNYFIVKVPENVLAKNVRVKYLIAPSTRNQKIKYYLTGQKPDTVEIPLNGAIYDNWYRDFVYDGYRYIINMNDIYVLRYKDIKYLKVLYDTE